MTRTISALALAAMTALGACSRHQSNPADSALNVDLSLAAQQQRSLDSLSAVERTEQANALTNGTPAAAPLAPVHHASSHVYRSSRTGSAGGSSASTHETVQKHTQRDAAIGAAAGAVIGATSSRSKVKGGIIGAAVGGILGGVIGNNVDKTKKP